MFLENSKPNKTFNLSTVPDILCLKRDNLNRVNRFALKFYNLMVESVFYTMARSKIIITCYFCFSFRVKVPKMVILKIEHIYIYIYMFDEVNCLR